MEQARSEVVALQRPHNKDNEEILKQYLFNTEEEQESMERRKQWLYQLWRTRKKALKEKEARNK